MGQGTGGHGALIAIEQDPSGSPGVFTTIGELMDWSWPDLSRETGDKTPQNDNINSVVVSAVLERGTFDIPVMYDKANVTHNPAAGLYEAIVDNETRGFRLRGPSGAASDDEWILSGRVTNVTRNAPRRAGVVELTATCAPSGKMIIDGVEIGTVT